MTIRVNVPLKRLEAVTSRSVESLCQQRQEIITSKYSLKRHCCVSSGERQLAARSPARAPHARTQHGGAGLPPPLPARSYCAFDWPAALPRHHAHRARQRLQSSRSPEEDSSASRSHAASLLHARVTRLKCSRNQPERTFFLSPLFEDHGTLREWRGPTRLWRHPAPVLW